LFRCGNCCQHRKVRGDRENCYHSNGSVRKLGSRAYRDPCCKEPVSPSKPVLAIFERLNYGRGTPHLQIQGEQIPILAQMETKEMEHQEREQLEPVTGEGENEVDEVAGKLEETALGERTDLPGENQIPLNKISDFTELRQDYLNYVNSCSQKFKDCKILPTVDRPDWGHIASQEGVIGARIGNQQDPGPKIASLTSKNTKKKKEK